jgi:mRNA interferase HigB
MVIITKSTLEKFAKIHPIAAEPLNNWYTITKEANWRNFADIKKSFNSVDAIGNDRYCFNIKGNEFRLIVLILFRTRTAFVIWLGTHSEYDKLNKITGAANTEFKK